MVNKNVLPMDTTRIRLDSMVSLEEKLEQCLTDYAKITHEFEQKRINIKNR